MLLLVEGRWCRVRSRSYFTWNCYFENGGGSGVERETRANELQDQIACIKRDVDH